MLLQVTQVHAGNLSSSDISSLNDQKAVGPIEYRYQRDIQKGIAIDRESKKQAVEQEERLRLIKIDKLVQAILETTIKKRDIRIVGPIEASKVAHSDEKIGFTDLRVFFAEVAGGSTCRISIQLSYRSMTPRLTDDKAEIGIGCVDSHGNQSKKQWDSFKIEKSEAGDFNLAK